jgi:CelD/BcsL family acetyltransferase involved in cellulose biosynthesis
VAGHDPHALDSRPSPPALGRRSPAPASVEVHDSPDALRADWDALADRTGAAPFLRPGWVEAWHRAFGTGRLAVFAVRRAGRIAGVLPVQLRRGALTSPTNWQTPLFGPVVEDREAAAELARGVLANARRRADLWFLDRDAPGMPECAAAAEDAGFGAIVRTIARSPYVPLDGSFEQYMAGLDRKFRKEIGRLWRRLEDRGEVRVDYDDGSERLDDLLSDGFRLEGSGWKAEAGSAIASDPSRESFYREVSRWAAERGWLRLAFLRVDGRAIAFDLCLEANGVFWALKGGFDVTERKLGPGVLLTHHQIERSFERGFSSYELLGQFDDYKASWTPLARDRVRFQAFPGTPSGAAEYLAWRRGRPLAKGLQAVARRAASSGSSSNPSR